MKKLLSKILFPFKWVFQQIGRCIKYIVQNFEQLFIVTLPNYFFGGLGVAIIIAEFKDFKKDTTGLTNYGFAILAGISSLCFSWLKTLDANKEPKMIKEISIAGEGSLHAAIIFLLSSALKYGSFHLNSVIPVDWKIFNRTFGVALLITYTISFTLGFYLVIEVVSKLNKILYLRLYKKVRE